MRTMIMIPLARIKTRACREMFEVVKAKWPKGVPICAKSLVEALRMDRNVHWMLADFLRTISLQGKMEAIIERFFAERAEASEPHREKVRKSRLKYHRSLKRNRRRFECGEIDSGKLSELQVKAYKRNEAEAATIHKQWDDALLEHRMEFFTRNARQIVSIFKKEFSSKK